MNRGAPRNLRKATHIPFADSEPREERPSIIDIILSIQMHQVFGVHGDPFESVLLTVIVFATPRILSLVADDGGEIKKTVNEHPRRDMKKVLTAAGRVAECWRDRRNKNTKCTHAASTLDPTPAP